MGRLRAAALRRFGSAVLVQSARHEAALAMLCRGGVRGIACAVERRAAVQARSISLSGQAHIYVPMRFAGLPLRVGDPLSLVLAHAPDMLQEGICTLLLFHAVP